MSRINSLTVSDLLLFAARLLSTLTLTRGIDLGSERAGGIVVSLEESQSSGATYSSHFRANQYSTKTWAVKRRPATLPLYRATPRKFRVLPQYMGEPVTLNGKPVTGASMRIPK
jgi:hypothetical protein